MFILMLFTLTVGGLTYGTYTYEDCKNLDFKPKACLLSEKMDSVSK